MDPISKFLPFILSVNSHGRINAVRVVEAVVMAGVVSAALKFWTIDELKLKVDSLTATVTELRQQVEKMRTELYEPRRR